MRELDVLGIKSSIGGILQNNNPSRVAEVLSA